MRNKDDHILIYFKDGVEFHFYFTPKTDNKERKIATAIFNLDGTIEQIVDALMEQLHRELDDTCRTELVKKVFIDVGDICYPDGIGCSYRPKDDVNMDFYTEYVVKIEKALAGMCDNIRGFVCCNTLGRFSRKNKKFYEISNSMLSSCELL